MELSFYFKLHQQGRSALKTFQSVFWLVVLMKSDRFQHDNQAEDQQ